MDTFIAALETAFDILQSFQIMGIPFFIWLLLPLLLGLIVRFIKGKKG